MTLKSININKSIQILCSLTMTQIEMVLLRDSTIRMKIHQDVSLEGPAIEWRDLKNIWSSDLSILMDLNAY